MKHRSGGLLFAVTLLLAGCLGNLRPVAQAEYDLGPVPPLAGKAAPVGVDVTAPSWLSGTTLYYRLLHAAPAQRHPYAASRWTAPPAELLRLYLQRRLAGADISAGCRVAVELVELEQVFTGPTESHVRLAVRVRFAAVHVDVDLEEPAPTPDAQGGVAAAGRAVGRLADRLAEWLRMPGAAVHCPRQGGRR